VAVSNYYKFSMRHAGRRSRDLNPLKVPNPSAYWEINDALVAQEIAALAPRVVITFRGRHVPILRQFAVIESVNDPAWIVRGGGGVLSPNRSWSTASSQVADSVALDLARDYADQATGRYNDRREQVRVYFLSY
jgi:hypothetical protein